MAAALVRDRRIRGSAVVAQGTEYPRRYVGPADAEAMAALLPAIGDAMPDDADCPAGTLVVRVEVGREPQGGRMAAGVVGLLHADSGGL
jgi:hypothetical protein